MAKKGPGDVAVLELVDRDLTSEGTVWLVEDILSCNFQTRFEVLSRKEEVKRWWSNYDLCYKLHLLVYFQ